ncbi:LytTR family transcriptional regulator DNA-binding domain-containing protein [Terrimonas ginsenosidimutans]|nr:LytTR family transcriptional regulator DNA-binding domain-containing protein [Terrimonas ginsenosidimutans]
MRNYFFIKERNNYIRIDLRAIIYAASMKHHTLIVLEGGASYTPHISLSRLAIFFPETEFVRINRDIILSMSKIDTFNAERAIIGKQIFSFSDLGKKQLLKNAPIAVHKVLSTRKKK